MDMVLSCLGLGGDSHTERIRDEPAQQYEPEKKTRSFTVLVTGMGAFPKNPGHDEDGHYSEDGNTSHLVTKYLPSHLTPHSKYNPSKFNIRILNSTSASGAAVKTEYGFARAYIKKLWEERGNSVDLVLHLGMADGWEWYSIEKSGWKEGTVKSVDEGEPVEYYMLPDDIGQTIRDLPGPCPWVHDVPDQLLTVPGIDVEVLVGRVKEMLNSDTGRKRDGEVVQVIPHPDAGNYLCGFVTYESLARAYVGRYRAKALFCHIPGWRDERRLKMGRDFVCSLIGQIAASQEDEIRQ